MRYRIEAHLKYIQVVSWQYDERLSRFRRGAVKKQYCQMTFVKKNMIVRIFDFNDQGIYRKV